jgi:hypothetical protein
VMETASNRNTKTYNPGYSSPRTAQKRTVTAISAWLDILSAATRCDFRDGVGKKGREESKVCGQGKTDPFRCEFGSHLCPRLGWFLLSALFLFRRI